MTRIIPVVVLVLCAAHVLTANAQKCYGSTQEFEFKLTFEGCKVKITPKECLPSDVTEAEQQSLYETSWKGTTIFATDADCNLTATFICGSGDKVKSDYTTCSSKWCSAMKDQYDAQKHARECDNDDDCNADGTLKTETKVCTSFGEDQVKKMCDMTDAEVQTRIGELQDLGSFGDVPNKDDCAEPFKVCFGRNTAACRRLIPEASPAAAFAACFPSSRPAADLVHPPQPAAAERVLMRMLRANDIVLSADAASGDLFFDRVVVNQHVHRPDLRSRVLAIEHEQGQLIVTPDHMLPIDGEMQPARLAKAGMALSSPQGEPLQISSVRSDVAGIINPITTSGSILAASTAGAPVLASTYGEWIAPLMAPQPLPWSMINWLAWAMPEAAQRFHDLVLEPFVVSSPLPAAFERTPAALAAGCWLLCDLALSLSLVTFAAGSAAGVSMSAHLVLAAMAAAAAALGLLSARRK